MRSLLLPMLRPVTLQSRGQNSINGRDAECYAMAKVALACRGESSWGSREEDSAKIDLVFSLAHPLKQDERLLVLSQVKSGKKYGACLENGFKLTKAAKKAAIRSTHGICVIWVDRDSNKIFWAYVHPTSTLRSQEYSAYHDVTPAMAFDLARCVGMQASIARKAKHGLIVRRRSGSASDRRKNVLKTYRRIGPIFCPAFGEIELTRLGWRHMFRAGRRQKNKVTSLDVIPYLEKFLSRWPSSHAITSHAEFESGGYVHRICEHLLKYDGVRLHDGASQLSEVVVYIRVIEEVRYPVDWESKVMLSQLLDRRVVLRSAYFK